MTLSQTVGSWAGRGPQAACRVTFTVDLADGFPLLTTKTVHWRSVVGELLWFLSGSTDVADLQVRGVSIWDEWATEDQTARFGRPVGELGPVYGHQWRNFGATLDPDTGRFRGDGVDQIRMVIDRIRSDPTSRRLVVSAWSPLEESQVTLPPCHTLFQFSVQGERLHCQLYQRSADVFLGVPFNLASYALLTSMVAHVTGLEPGRFVHSLGDVHVYTSHFGQVETQLARHPRPLPLLELNPAVTDIDAFTADDIVLVGYEPAGRIAAPVAV